MYMYMYIWSELSCHAIIQFVSIEINISETQSRDVILDWMQ